MKTKIIKIYPIIAILAVNLLLSVNYVFAQDRAPVREFTNPEELVSLGSETTIPQAFAIFNHFAREHRNKVIIDRSGKSNSIGFDVPSMFWRQALDFIANAHDLVINEQTDFIEITPRPVTDTRQGTQARTTPVGSMDPATTPTQQAEILASLSTKEIEISAIFFEGNRRKLREIGVNWSAIKEGDFNVDFSAASQVSIDMFGINIPQQNMTGGWQLGGFMNALESLNLGEVLASPSIKVMDGKRGDIQVGQDISIKQRDFAGNVTDAFVQTGTILTVTPTIITDNDTSFIFLNINAERSTGQPDPVSTIINKQSASTQVLLFSGESTVIAGLFETEEVQVRRGIPFLKDLPPWFFGLRYLFGYNSIEQNEKELVIVLKAEIIPSLRERFDMERRSREALLQEGREFIRTSPVIPVQ